MFDGGARGRIATARLRPLLHVILLADLGACGGYAGRPNDIASDTGFVVRGNPEASTGAAWTYKGTVDGVRYDLTGVLYKPQGPGPFPAVLLSHGYDGSAELLAGMLATKMVTWGRGLVCIAVNTLTRRECRSARRGERTNRGRASRTSSALT